MGSLGPLGGSTHGRSDSRGRRLPSGANESESEELVRYIPHECSAPSGLRPGAMRESAPDQLRSL